MTSAPTLDREQVEPRTLPPYQDTATLCKNLCITEATVDRWVKTGKLPRPKVHGRGKRLWKWAEVEAKLDGVTRKVTSTTEDRIRHATRQRVAAGHR